MAFDNVRLPEDIERGAMVGPMFQTGIVTLSGGSEQRNASWDQERLQADISYGIMQKDDPEDIENSFSRIMRFYRARRGRHRGFRFRDLSDFEAVNEKAYPLEDETKKFQLCKSYEDYVRRITRAVYGTLIVYVNGILVPAQGNWTVNELGVISFLEVPTGGVTADFEFDVPMRFDSDVASVAIEWQNAGSVSSMKLIQIRE